jgi:hypothetical protein
MRSKEILHFRWFINGTICNGTVQTNWKKKNEYLQSLRGLSVVAENRRELT